MIYLFNRIGLSLDFFFTPLISVLSVRVFSPNPNSIVRIVEYSTISVLEYFEDTLANVGLPEASLKCDLNCVTRVENRYVKRELK